MKTWALGFVGADLLSAFAAMMGPAVQAQTAANRTTQAERMALSITDPAFKEELTCHRSAKRGGDLPALSAGGPDPEARAGR